jgi:RHS repeat-associated protein
MLQPNRHKDSKFYRYGFQGQEKDDEIKGEGNSVNYKYRMHDPRIGRFFAVDPLTKKYPHYTPYSFSGNKVVHAVELEGLEEVEVSGTATIDIGNSTHFGGVSFSGSASLKVGDFKASAGLGVDGYSNFANTGKTGVMLRGSLQMGFENSNTSANLGTNLFKGLGAMSEFDQRTGILNFTTGKFSFSYENDGMPFALGQSGLKSAIADGDDKYRTAAVRVGWGSSFAGFNLFTGKRNNYKGDSKKNGKMKWGQFGERMPNGFVIEEGAQYRMGALYLGNGDHILGIDSDRYVRHPIQDMWAHNMKFPINTVQPGFKSLSDGISPFYQARNAQSSMPRFTLYDF